MLIGELPDIACKGSVKNGISTDGQPSQEMPQLLRLGGMAVRVVVTDFTAGFVWVIARVATPQY